MNRRGSVSSASPDKPFPSDVPAWEVERYRGTAEEFHAMSPSSTPGRRALVFSIDRPALVLGSAQRDDLVDRRKLEEAGIDLVWRRSGGAAVLLKPGNCTWVDMIVARNDPLVVEDVTRSFLWLGEVWRDALSDVGVEAVLQKERLPRNPWVSILCFAGIGPGEVHKGGAKLVGFSQRRTRDWVRFQCLAQRVPAESELLNLLGIPAVDRRHAMNEFSVTPIPVEPERLIEAVLARLPS